MPRTSEAGPHAGDGALLDVVVLPRLPGGVIEVVRTGLSGVADIVVGDLAHDRDGTLELLTRCDAVVGFPYAMDEECFAVAEGRLRLIQLLAAGSDEMDVAGAGRHGIAVATNGGANSVPVAEHAVMLILAALKDLVPFVDGLRGGVWPASNTYSERVHELAESRVGLVGFGKIGRDVARRLGVFGARVLYYDPLRAAPEVEADLGATYLPLDELLRESDVVSLHLPLTADTRAMIGAAELDALGRDGILVNTARGALVDEVALLAALRAGAIRSAMLDTLSAEPPAGIGLELIGEPRCVVTPHSAGSSWESWGRRCGNAAANLERLRDGLPLQWVVGTAAGTRG